MPPVFIDNDKRIHNIEVFLFAGIIALLLFGVALDSLKNLKIPWMAWVDIIDIFLGIIFLSISLGKLNEIGVMVISSWSQKLDNWIILHKQRILLVMRYLGIMISIVIAKYLINLEWKNTIGYLLLSIIASVIYDLIKNRQRNKN